MKLSTVLSIGALASFGLADESQDAAFLTAFVSDYASNRRQYVDYFMTAGNLPQGLTKLALAVATYTDDSYTTLANAPGIDITSIMEFATALPWYTRLEAEGLSLSGLSAGTQSSGSRSTSSSGDAGVSMALPGSALVAAVAVLLL